MIDTLQGQMLVVELMVLGSLSISVVITDRLS